MRLLVFIGSKLWITSDSNEALLLKKNRFPTLTMIQTNMKISQNHILREIHKHPWWFIRYASNEHIPFTNCQREHHPLTFEERPLRSWTRSHLESRVGHGSQIEHDRFANSDSRWLSTTLDRVGVYFLAGLSQVGSGSAGIDPTSKPGQAGATSIGNSLMWD